jgi:hypothetical protein
VRQSTVVILALFAAFAVFVTIRGELPAYLGLLGLGKAGASAAAAPAAGSSSSSSPASLIQAATSIAPAFGALSSIVQA